MSAGLVPAQGFAMLAAAFSTPSRREQYEASREQYMTALNQSKLSHASNRAAADHAQATAKQDTATGSGPVLDFMESVVSELICSRGCRHAIDAIQRLHEQIDGKLPVPCLAWFAGTQCTGQV